ncbi:MAG: zinc ABC transporter substrate-binding protein [Anaerolineales bacterium]|nr:zinc ABC transporter substrate-binding protein [Anaerolineales bacterium]
MKFWLALLTVILLASCASPAPEAESASGAEALTVVATTTIIGDVVSQVGGEHIQVAVLLPVGADPHSFDPTPQDVAKMADADIIFANGVGLEAFLDNLIESAGAAERVVYLDEGIELLARAGDTDEHEDEGHEDENGDPHLWTDPNNVIVWTHTITRTLNELDPAHATAYSENADAYAAELMELDAWIREQVAQIPAENREIITDHTLLGYFVDEYGFNQVGAIVPGYSSMAEPSAQELAQIEDAIASLGVQAIFVGNSVNPTLAERVAADTGVQLIFFYTGSLSEAGGEAGTYLDYMRYNTTAIVEAQK